MPFCQFYLGLLNQLRLHWNANLWKKCSENLQVSIPNDFNMFLFQWIKHIYSEKLNNVVEIKEILVSQPFLEHVFSEWGFHSCSQFCHTSIYITNGLTKSVSLGIFISFQSSLSTDISAFEWCYQVLVLAVGYQLGSFHIADFWKIPEVIWQHHSLSACAGDTSCTWD